MCVSFAQTEQKCSYAGYLCYGEPEESNRAVWSDKICGRIGKSNTAFKSHLTDCSAFVYVDAERGIAREMTWGERFPPTTFTSVWRRPRVNQTKMRHLSVCKHSADFKTRVPFFFLWACTFLDMAVVWRWGFAHSNQDGNFNPMAGIHITVKAKWVWSKSKGGFRRLNLEGNTTTCFSL